MASFEHHAAETLPVFSEGGADIRLIIGSAYGHTAPTTMLSPTIYFHAEMAPGASLTLPGGHDELAVYLVSGDADMGGVALEPGQMGTIDGSSTTVSSRSGARVMVLGGAVIGKRFIEWNFVSSSKERLEKSQGGLAHQRRRRMGPHALYAPTGRKRIHSPARRRFARTACPVKRLPDDLELFTERFQTSSQITADVQEVEYFDVWAHSPEDDEMHGRAHV